MGGPHATIRLFQPPSALMPPVRLIALLLTLTLTASCGSRPAANGADVAKGTQPIVVQGAMDIEVRTLVAALEQPAEEHIQGWTFWSGTIKGVRVVVSKTL